MWRACCHARTDTQTCTHAHPINQSTNYSKDPGFESAFATVSKCGHLRSLHDAPVHSGKINVKISGSERGAVSKPVVRQVVSMYVMCEGVHMLCTEVKGRVRRSYASSVGRGSAETGSTGFGYEMKFRGNNYDTVTC